MATSAVGTDGREFDNDADDIANDVGSDDGSSGNATGEGVIIDPATGTSTDAPYGRTPTGRVRKRPVAARVIAGSVAGSSAGSSSRKSASKVSSDVSEILMMLHWAAATALKMPEIELTSEESDKLGESIVRVTELYSEIPGLNEKSMAWVKLGGTLATVYGTRVLSIVASKKSAAKNNLRVM